RRVGKGAAPTWRSCTAQVRAVPTRADLAARYSRRVPTAWARRNGSAELIRFSFAFPTDRCGLPAVAQAGRDAVDAEVDAFHRSRVAFAGAVALDQLDLNVMQRVDVGEAVADRAGEQRICFQQGFLPGDRQQDLDRIVPFGAQPGEHMV